MRLNNGMPVWHASISISTPDGRRVRSAGVAERAATRALIGVGSDREWWIWNSATGVGHLRIGLTEDEFARTPHGIATVDAGPSGPERKRRKGRS